MSSKRKIYTALGEDKCAIPTGLDKRIHLHLDEDLNFSRGPVYYEECEWCQTRQLSHDTKDSSPYRHPRPT
jgi:hypothetical protein